MEGTTRVPVDIPLVDMGYKCNSRNVLVFSATEGARSTEPGDPYFSHYPENYSIFSIHTVVCTHFLVRYSNACN